MVAILASIGSLLMVLAVCWVGVQWMAARVHRHGFNDLDLELRDLTDDRCFECNGVGASHHLGELRPCPTCEGTGITTAPF